MNESNEERIKELEGAIEFLEANRLSKRLEKNWRKHFGSIGLGMKRIIEEQRKKEDRCLEEWRREKNEEAGFDSGCSTKDGRLEKRRLDEGLRPRPLPQVWQRADQKSQVLSTVL